MDPSSIILNSTHKLFQYEMISREIDTCNDIAELKNIAKCYVKLHFSQEETISTLGMM